MAETSLMQHPVWQTTFCIIMKVAMTPTIPALLQNNPSSCAVYEALSRSLAEMGPVTVEEKKTSLHLTNGRAAFLGVHPRKQGLRLNIVLAEAMEGPRVVKAERVSAYRYHNEVDVKQPAEVDSELLGWIQKAYVR